MRKVKGGGEEASKKTESWFLCTRHVTTKGSIETNTDAEVLLYVHRNRRFLKDRSPGRTSTSTFTQLLTSTNTEVLGIVQEEKFQQNVTGGNENLV